MEREKINNSSFKIYWVSLVWPKWQIIIPKDTRIDFDIDIWNEFEIWTIDDIAFWIWKKGSINDKYFKKEMNFKNFWQVCIWSKYQFVIPSTIRKILNISPWDSLVIIWKPWKWVWFIKNDEIDYVFK